MFAFWDSTSRPCILPSQRRKLLAPATRQLYVGMGGIGFSTCVGRCASAVEVYAGAPGRGGFETRPYARMMGLRLLHQSYTFELAEPLQVLG